MRKKLVSQSTLYPFNLTSNFNVLSSKDNDKTIEKQTSDPSSQQDCFSHYKKEQKGSYLDYFNYVLSLKTTHQIKLQSRNQPFTLVEDLYILTQISKNPNKVIVKVLQELAKNTQIYKSNYKYLYIKRSLKKIKDRYKLLQENIKQQQLNFIIYWIQTHGLQQPAFIHIPNQQSNPIIKSKIQIVSKLNPKITPQKTEKTKKKQYQKRNQSINYVLNQNQQKLSLFEKSSRQKKLKRKQIPNRIECLNDTSMKVDIDKIFQTPKIKQNEIKQQNAPTKQVKNQIIRETSKLNVQNKKVDKRRRFLRVIDEKKDVLIKEDSGVEFEQNTEHQTRDIKIQLPQIQQIQLQTQKKLQFRVQAPKTCQLKVQALRRLQQRSKSPKVSNSRVDGKEQILQQINEYSMIVSEESREQCLRLQNVLSQFQSKSNCSKIRILKYLDEVSGDLDDLKKYLETEDRNILWKRVEDAVLRKYVRAEISQHRFKFKKDRLINGQVLKLEAIYKEIVSIKGKQRISKRIKYLGLKG